MRQFSNCVVDTKYLSQELVGEFLRVLRFEQVNTSSAQLVDLSVATTKVEFAHHNIDNSSNTAFNKRGIGLSDNVTKLVVGEAVTIQSWKVSKQRLEISFDCRQALSAQCRRERLEFVVAGSVARRRHIGRLFIYFVEE
ncbi:hypothetical protein WK34_14765 [Burkholderia vietnamiensis]|nr:hypothetical protein WK34_14765 [Burkholderia vietnamiensis]